MKIHFFYDKEMILFLNNYYSASLDIESKENLESYFKELFLRIHKIYKIALYGYYNINLYYDKYYGVILKIQKEDLDYYDYFDKEIDMRIIVEKNSVFLYQIDDFFELDDEILSKGILYRYQNKIYFKLNENLSWNEMGKLLEFSDIVYENTDVILKYAKKICLNL